MEDHPAGKSVKNLKKVDFMGFYTEVWAELAARGLAQLAKKEMNDVNGGRDCLKPFKEYLEIYIIRVGKLWF